MSTFRLFPCEVFQTDWNGLMRLMRRKERVVVNITLIKKFRKIREIFGLAQKVWVSKEFSSFFALMPSIAAAWRDDGLRISERANCYGGYLRIYIVGGSCETQTQKVPPLVCLMWVWRPDAIKRTTVFTNSHQRVPEHERDSLARPA